MDLRGQKQGVLAPLHRASRRFRFKAKSLGADKRFIHRTFIAGAFFGSGSVRGIAGMVPLTVIELMEDLRNR